MNTENIFRCLRGALGNAVVWGAGWAALGFAAFAGLKVTGNLPASAIWLDSILIAARFGFIGGIVGGALSGLIGLLYRGRRLSDLHAVRFGIGGGIVAGVFVPAFLQMMNLLSGGGMVPMGLVLDDAVWATVFGAVAAGGSLALAQRAHTMLPGTSKDRPGLLGSVDGLATADGWGAGRRGAPAWRSAGD